MVFLGPLFPFFHTKLFKEKNNIWQHITELFQWGRHCAKHFSYYTANPSYKESVSILTLRMRLPRILVYWSCHNKVPQNGWLKATEMYFLTVLGSRSPKSALLAGLYSLKFLGENLFCAFLLTSGVARHPEFSLACSCILTPVSASILTWSSSLCVSLSVSFPLLIRTSVILY